MPQVQAVIGHLVGGACYVIGLGEVLEVSLVDTVESQKIARGPQGGD